MPYKLKPGVYLVTGALRGAVLDTNSSKVYSVNRSAVEVLLNKRAGDAYWQELNNFGLVEKSTSVRIERYSKR